MHTGPDDTLEDFRRQCDRIPLPSRSQLSRLFVRMTPVEDAIVVSGLRRIRGIIDAMTPDERGDPTLIGPNRRSRIAAGSGTNAQEVSEFLLHFAQIRTRARRLATLNLWERLKVELGWSRMREG